MCIRDRFKTSLFIQTPPIAQFIYILYPIIHDETIILWDKTQQLHIQKRDCQSNGNPFLLLNCYYYEKILRFNKSEIKTNNTARTLVAVSYTHLDVYKRQAS